MSKQESKILYKQKYIKGKVYVPDSVDICPVECNKYFSDEEFQSFKKDYEMGSVRCLETFEITISVRTFL